MSALNTLQPNGASDALASKLFAACVDIARSHKPEPDANTHLAQSLSPSQLDKWRDCQASWYFKYVVGLEEPTDGNRAQGRAVHKVAEIYYRTYLETRERLDLAACIALYRSALQAELEGPVVLNDGDTLEFLEREGIGLLAKYLAEVAHTIEPAKLETAVEGKIGGVHVRGRLDILDVDGKVIDVKTAAKSPSAGRVAHRQRIQLATYAMLEPACSGQAEVTHLVKNKTPKVVQQVFEIGPKDKEMVSKLYPLAQAGMRSGMYYPNRESFFCSKRHCSFWSACEKEFGGEVND